MLAKKKGRQTVEFTNPPSIIATASIVGPKEGKGPLGKNFDYITEDEKWGEKSWEKSEAKFIKETLVKVLTKGAVTPEKVDYVIAGDLLNQCIAAHYGVRDSSIPLIGVYGACSTMGESMGLAAMLIDGGYANTIVSITSSHFCSAEKQFRAPVEQGTQRPPTAQWTVTGSGAALISSEGDGPYIKRFTTGKIVDLGVKDAANMGAAMAPAAVDTIYSHFEDTGLPLDYYDLIITGDLGMVGHEICKDLLSVNGMDFKDSLDDCGIRIYDMKKQDPHAGGSGCGCSATVFAGFLYNELVNYRLKKILFVPTGALHSSLSTQQGESIPCIAHAVGIEGSV